MNKTLYLFFIVCDLQSSHCSSSSLGDQQVGLHSSAGHSDGANELSCVGSEE